MKVLCVRAYGKIMLGQFGEKSAYEDVECLHEAQYRI